MSLFLHTRAAETPYQITMYVFELFRREGGEKTETPHSIKKLEELFKNKKQPDHTIDIMKYQRVMVDE
jgi:hypothetical protein